MQSVERECIIYICTRHQCGSVSKQETGFFEALGILMELGDFNGAWRFEWSLQVLMELGEFNGAWRF